MKNLRAFLAIAACFAFLALLSGTIPTQSAYSPATQLLDSGGVNKASINASGAQYVAQFTAIPAFVQVAQNNSGVTSLAFSSANVGGDALVLGTRTGATATDSNGNQWNALTDAAYAVNVSGGANTVALSTSSQVALAEYSGVGTFQQTGAQVTGTGTSLSAGAITTTENNSLVVAIGFNTTTNSPSYTAGSGFTLDTTSTNNIFIEHEVVATAGSVTASITNSTSVALGIQVIVFNTTGPFTVNQGASTPNIGGAWPTLQTVVTNSTLGSAGFLRTPNVFHTAQATASGNTAAWTPTSGKKFRLMRYRIDVTDNATLGSAGVDTISLQDGSTAINIALDCYIPSTAITTPFGTGCSSGGSDIGNGYLSTTANNVLNINIGTTLTAGNVRVQTAGTEE